LVYFGRQKNSVQYQRQTQSDWNNGALFSCNTAKKQHEPFVKIMERRMKETALSFGFVPSQKDNR
jgi:hypothetical protein